MHRTLELSTTGPGLTEITRDVAAVVSGQGDGLLTLLVQHTSASLLIQENADPDVQRDLMGFFGRLVPRGDDPAMRWLSHTMEGPGRHARPYQGGFVCRYPCKSRCARGG
jgi:secondary thiamine-phosphate synthase enzyme